MPETLPTPALQFGQLRVLFVDRVPPGDAAFMTFTDPQPSFAILLDDALPSPPQAAPANTLEIVLTTPPPSSHPPEPASVLHSMDPLGSSESPLHPPVFIKYRGVELTWRPGHALLQCAAAQAHPLLAAIVEFAHYELELRQLEDQLAQSWTDLELDKKLAFQVTPADLERSDIVGARMDRTLQRRFAFARIEPHLLAPSPGLSAIARKLGEELREKSQIEARLETLDDQLEVFEYVYEMGSQRMGEFRGSRQEHTLEWIIILLLALETLVTLAGILLKRTL